MHFLDTHTFWKKILLSTVNMVLIYISQQIVIYVGILFLIAGVFGNRMNTYIFSSVNNYRTAP